MRIKPVICAALLLLFGGVSHAFWLGRVSHRSGGTLILVPPPVAPTIVNSTNNEPGTPAISSTIATPSECIGSGCKGDLLMLLIGDVTIPTTPSGWTQAHTIYAGGTGGTQTTILTKIATASEPSTLTIGHLPFPGIIMLHIAGSNGSLTPDQIQDTVDGGTLVQSLSVPALNGIAHSPDLLITLMDWGNNSDCVSIASGGGNTVTTVQNLVYTHDINTGMFVGRQALTGTSSVSQAYTVTAPSGTCSPGGGGGTSFIGTAIAIAPGVSNPPPTGYAADVLTDAPAYYWKLAEATGTVAADSSDANTGTYVGGVTLGNAGAARATPDTSASFNGTTGRVQTATQLTNPGSTGYTLEAFANVAAGACPLIQLNSSQTANGGSSDSYDRQLYIGTDNKLYFGQYTGSVVTVVSPSTVTGAFHHLVGQWDGTNLFLFVDGVLVAGPTAASAPQNFNGYWTIGGGEQVNLWPNSGGGAATGPVWCNGKIQEVAVYNPALSAARIYHHATGSNPLLTAIAVSPTPATIFGTNNTLQFSATGTFSNNATSNVSGSCTWDTANHTIATINSSGLATSVALGGPINVTCTDP